MNIDETALWMIAVHNQLVKAEAKRGIQTEESGFYSSWWNSLYLSHQMAWRYAITNYDHLIKRC